MFSFFFFKESKQNGKLSDCLWAQCDPFDNRLCAYINSVPIMSIQEQGDH